MSVYEREGFGEFLHRIIRIRLDAELAHPVHDALLEGRHNDEETVATIAVSPGDAVRARKALRTIHNDFPYGASVPEQAAFLLRAFIGLDPFGDDDRRTGWTYLVGLLNDHGWTLHADETAQTALVSHLQSRLDATHPGGFQRRHALDRDDVFSGLVDWFDRHLTAHAEGADQHL